MSERVRLNMRVLKVEQASWESYAKSVGMTLTDLIRRAVNEYVGMVVKREIKEPEDSSVSSRLESVSRPVRLPGERVVLVGKKGMLKRAASELSTFKEKGEEV